MKSDTNPQVIAQRKDQLQNYLRQVLNWVRKGEISFPDLFFQKSYRSIFLESPWVRGESISREWMQCTLNLDGFLAVNEMAPLYPKIDFDKEKNDVDHSVHPSIKHDKWFQSIIQRGLCPSVILLYQFSNRSIFFSFKISFFAIYFRFYFKFRWITHKFI